MGWRHAFLNKPASLEEQLRLARIDEAAKILGFDAFETLVKPLSAQEDSIINYADG
jgi:hypothetical protein